uniref:Maleylacetoacetate isomerase n=1 Tax=Panagrolaimus sp. ES5 TaxID=591445 RepID=A0AC34FW00_9BILA
MLKPILYNNWRSSSSWRTRIALELKGIEYEYRAVNLFDGEQNNEKHLEMNPFGLVPVFIFDGKVYTESMAIIEFLEEKFPEKRKLFPNSAEDRAVVRSLAYQITLNIQPIQNMRVRNRVGQNDPKKVADFVKYFTETGFEALEKELQKTSGIYAFGDTVTLADVVIPSQVANALRYGVSMEKYPTIQRINETLGKLPEFIEADCWHQPDTPENKKKVFTDSTN